jgi:hypothetical protein
MPNATKPKPKPMTKPLRKRYDLAVTMWRSTAGDRDAIGFSTRMFVQANLPHSDPGDIEFWSKQNGKAVLTIRQGFNIGPNNEILKIGFPYGSAPRLCLIYFASEAVKTKSPRIQLGGSMSEFMRRIGMPRDARNIRMLKKQMARLLAADIRFTYGDKNVTAGKNGSIADDYILWWDERRDDPEQRHLWPSQIILNQSFFEEIIDHGFPLDLDAIAGIKKSPLALDYYGWLAYRINTITHDAFIPWASLHEQVGSSYSTVKDFKRYSKPALRMVNMFWPSLKLSFANGGVVIKPSPTPVPKLNEPA